MALIIPTSRSTYADAAWLPGGPLSPYVLVQLPADADLGWLSDIRRLAAVDEVKWKIVQTRREHLQSKRDLWKGLVDAMRTATVVVIRPADVEQELRHYLKTEGAEEGLDYDNAGVVEVCGIALIADTPVAYLPSRMAELLGLYPPDLYLSLDKFVPERILARIGGGLRDARVFAARAHAMFDSGHLTHEGARTADAYGYARRTVVLRELLSTERGFDKEHPRSVAVLNEAADAIAEALEGALLLPGGVSDRPLVREYSSRDVDQLQAADVGAGWAHELLALGDERALLAAFGRVLLNGRLLR